MALVFYVALVQPYRIGFAVEPQGFMFYFEMMIDAVFILDLIINFRTGYVDPSTGKRELRSAFIARNYFFGYFWIDFISSVPWDQMIPAGDDIKLLKTVRLVRLTKLGRLARVKRLVDRFTEVLELEREHINVIFAVCGIIFASHILACAWGGIPRIMGPEHMMYENSWYLSTGVVDEPIMTQYCYALYWAVTTVTTVGYGDISPQNMYEMVFVIIAMVVSGAFYGYLVASISAYFMASDAHMMQFEEKMRELRAYMRLRKYPQDLQKKMKAFFSHYYNKRTDFDELMMLQQLPFNVSEEVSTYLSDRLMERHFVFSGVAHSQMTLVLGIMRPRRLAGGERLEAIGQRAVEMFVLNRGKIEISDSEGRILTWFSDEQSFMEYSAVGLIDHHFYNAFSEATCDLYSIRADELRSTIKPHVLQHIKRRVELLEAGRGILGHSLIVKPTDPRMKPLAAGYKLSPHLTARKRLQSVELVATQHSAEQVQTVDALDLFSRPPQGTFFNTAEHSGLTKGPASKSVSKGLGQSVEFALEHFEDHVKAQIGGLESRIDQRMSNMEERMVEEIKKAVASLVGPGSRSETQSLI